MKQVIAVLMMGLCALCAVMLLFVVGTTPVHFLVGGWAVVLVFWFYSLGFVQGPRNDRALNRTAAAWSMPVHVPIRPCLCGHEFARHSSSGRCRAAQCVCCDFHDTYE